MSTDCPRTFSLTRLLGTKQSPRLLHRGPLVAWVALGLIFGFAVAQMLSYIKLGWQVVAPAGGVLAVYRHPQNVSRGDLSLKESLVVLPFQLGHPGGFDARCVANKARYQVSTPD